MMGLTVKQSELHRYLTRHFAVHGHGPSYEEMRVAVGLASKSGVNRLLTGLEQRGYIRRLKHLSRGVELLERDPHALLRAAGVSPWANERLAAYCKRTGWQPGEAIDRALTDYYFKLFDDAH